jgi:hypothetical protein
LPALRSMSVKLEDTNILVDVSSGVFRLLVPGACRRAGHAVHDCKPLSVAGSGCQCLPLVPQVHGMRGGEGHAAQQGRRQLIGVPLLRFSHLHIDLVGPLPTSAAGYTHLFTIIDRSTRWCEAVPLRSTTADDCALISGWVARFGVPAVLTSDRSVQFS